MSSKTRTYVSMTEDGEPGGKQVSYKFCFWLTLVAFILAVLVIIGLAVGLGITINKLNSEESSGKCVIQ